MKDEIARRLETIAAASNGTLTTEDLKKVTGEFTYSYMTVYQLARKMGLYTPLLRKVRVKKNIEEVTPPPVPFLTEIEERVEKKKELKFIFTQEELDQVQEIVHKLEGVSEGIGLYHPRVANYINKQLNLLFRIIYKKKESALPNLSELSKASKPEWKEIDREVESSRRKDRILARKLEEQEAQDDEL